MFTVAVVCSGNICRSPIGEKVLQAAFQDAELGDQVRVESFGTGGWHVGDRADSRAEAVLAKAGYPTEHRARQITPEDLTRIDLVLAADAGHLHELHGLAADVDPAPRIALLRSFDPQADGQDVPDPYFGSQDGFDRVLAMTVAAAPGVVEAVRSRLQR